MEKKLIKKKDFRKEDWFKRMFETIEAIIVETAFQSRWLLIQGYHEVGKEIIECSEKYKVERREICQAIATRCNKSERTIYYAIEFAERFPKIDKLPGGKSISWHRVCNELLGDGKERGECLHDGGLTLKKFCRKCGRWIKET